MLYTLFYNINTRVLQLFYFMINLYIFFFTRCDVTLCMLFAKNMMNFYSVFVDKKKTGSSIHIYTHVHVGESVYITMLYGNLSEILALKAGYLSNRHRGIYHSYMQFSFVRRKKRT